MSSDELPEPEIFMLLTGTKTREITLPARLKKSLTIRRSPCTEGDVIIRGTDLVLTEDSPVAVFHAPNLNPDLLPCPFCSGKAFTNKVETGPDELWQVRCVTCGMGVTEEGTEKEAVAAWNKRI